MFSGYKDATSCYNSQPLFENRNQAPFLPGEISKQTGPPWDYSQQSFSTVPCYTGDQNMNHRHPSAVHNPQVISQFENNNVLAHYKNITGNTGNAGNHQSVVRPRAVINCQSNCNACYNHSVARIPHWNPPAESVRYVGGNTAAPLPTDEVSRFAPNLPVPVPNFSQHEDASHHFASGFANHLTKLSRFSKDQPPGISTEAPKKNVISPTEDGSMLRVQQHQSRAEPLSEKYIPPSASDNNPSKKDLCVSCRGMCNKPNCKMYQHQPMKFPNLEPVPIQQYGVPRENVVRYTGHSSSTINNGSSCNQWHQPPGLWPQNGRPPGFWMPASEDIRNMGNASMTNFWSDRSSCEITGQQLLPPPPPNYHEVTSNKSTSQVRNQQHQKEGNVTESDRSEKLNHNLSQRYHKMGERTQRYSDIMVRRKASEEMIVTESGLKYHELLPRRSQHHESMPECNLTQDMRYRQDVDGRHPLQVLKPQEDSQANKDITADRSRHEASNTNTSELCRQEISRSHINSGGINFPSSAELHEDMSNQLQQDVTRKYPVPTATNFASYSHDIKVSSTSTNYSAVLGIAQPPSRFNSNLTYTQSKISRSNNYMRLFTDPFLEDSYNHSSIDVGNNFVSQSSDATVTSNAGPSHRHIPFHNVMNKDIPGSGMNRPIQIPSHESTSLASDTIIRYGNLKEPGDAPSVITSSTSVTTQISPHLQSCGRMASSDNIPTYHSGGTTMQVVESNPACGMGRSGVNIDPKHLGNSYGSSPPQRESVLAGNHHLSYQNMLSNTGSHGMPACNMFYDSNSLSQMSSSLNSGLFSNAELHDMNKNYSSHIAGSNVGTIGRLSKESCHNTLSGIYSQNHMNIPPEQHLGLLPLMEDTSANRPIKKRKPRTKGISKSEQIKMLGKHWQQNTTNQQMSTPVLDVRQFLATWDEETDMLSPAPKLPDVVLSNNNAENPLLVLDCRTLNTNGVATLSAVDRNSLSDGNASGNLIHMYQEQLVSPSSNSTNSNIMKPNHESSGSVPINPEVEDPSLSPIDHDSMPNNCINLSSECVSNHETTSVSSLEQSSHSLYPVEDYGSHTSNGENQPSPTKSHIVDSMIEENPLLSESSVISSHCSDKVASSPGNISRKSNISCSNPIQECQTPTESIHSRLSPFSEDGNSFQDVRLKSTAAKHENNKIENTISAADFHQNHLERIHCPTESDSCQKVHMEPKINVRNLSIDQEIPSYGPLESRPTQDDVNRTSETERNLTLVHHSRESSSLVHMPINISSSVNAPVHRAEMVPSLKTLCMSALNKKITKEETQLQRKAPAITSVKKSVEEKIHGLNHGKKNKKKVVTEDGTSGLISSTITDICSNSKNYLTRDLSVHTSVSMDFSCLSEETESILTDVSELMTPEDCSADKMSETSNTADSDPSNMEMEDVETEDCRTLKVKSMCEISTKEKSKSMCEISTKGKSFKPSDKNTTEIDKSESESSPLSHHDATNATDGAATVIFQEAVPPTQLKHELNNMNVMNKEKTDSIEGEEKTDPIMTRSSPVFSKPALNNDVEKLSDTHSGQNSLLTNSLENSTKTSETSPTKEEFNRNRPTIIELRENKLDIPMEDIDRPSAVDKLAAGAIDRSSCDGKEIKIVASDIVECDKSSSVLIHESSLSENEHLNMYVENVPLSTSDTGEDLDMSVTSSIPTTPFSVECEDDDLLSEEKESLDLIHEKIEVVSEEILDSDSETKIELHPTSESRSCKIDCNLFGSLCPSALSTRIPVAEDGVDCPHSADTSDIFLDENLKPTGKSNTAKSNFSSTVEENMNRKCSSEIQNGDKLAIKEMFVLKTLSEVGLSSNDHLIQSYREVETVGNVDNRPTTNTCGKDQKLPPQGLDDDLEFVNRFAEGIQKQTRDETDYERVQILKSSPCSVLEFGQKTDLLENAKQNVHGHSDVGKSVSVFDTKRAEEPFKEIPECNKSKQTAFSKKSENDSMAAHTTKPSDVDSEQEREVIPLIKEFSNCSSEVKPNCALTSNSDNLSKFNISDILSCELSVILSDSSHSDNSPPEESSPHPPLRNVDQKLESDSPVPLIMEKEIVSLPTSSSSSEGSAKIVLRSSYNSPQVNFAESSDKCQALHEVSIESSISEECKQNEMFINMPGENSMHGTPTTDSNLISDLSSPPLRQEMMNSYSENLKESCNLIDVESNHLTERDLFVKKEDCTISSPKESSHIVEESSKHLENCRHVDDLLSEKIVNCQENIANLDKMQEPNSDFCNSPRDILKNICQYNNNMEDIDSKTSDGEKEESCKISKDSCGLKNFQNRTSLNVDQISTCSGKKSYSSFEIANNTPNERPMLREEHGVMVNKNGVIKDSESSISLMSHTVKSSNSETIALKNHPVDTGSLHFELLDHHSASEKNCENSVKIVAFASDVHASTKECSMIFDEHGGNEQKCSNIQHEAENQCLSEGDDEPPSNKDCESEVGQKSASQNLLADKDHEFKLNVLLGTTPSICNDTLKQTTKKIQNKTVKTSRKSEESCNSKSNKINKLKVNQMPENNILLPDKDKEFEELKKNVFLDVDTTINRSVNMLEENLNKKIERNNEFEMLHDSSPCITTAVATFSGTITVQGSDLSDNINSPSEDCNLTSDKNNELEDVENSISLHIITTTGCNEASVCNNNNKTAENSTNTDPSSEDHNPKHSTTNEFQVDQKSKVSRMIFNENGETEELLDSIAQSVIKSVGNTESVTQNYQENVNTNKLASENHNAEPKGSDGSEVNQNCEGHNTIPSNSNIFEEDPDFLVISRDAGHTKTVSQDYKKITENVTNEEPKSGNRENATYERKSGNHENATDEPKSGNRENVNQNDEEPKSGKHENATVELKSGNHENVTVEPKSGNHRHATDEPKSENHENVTDEPKSGNHENVTDEPKSGNHKNVTDEPKSGNHENATDELKSANHENVIDELKSGNCENVIDEPKSGNRENVTDEPKSGNQENATDEPKSGSLENATDEPKSESYENATDEPKSENHENVTDEPKSGNQENRTGELKSGNHENTIDESKSGNCENVTDEPKSGYHENATDESKSGNHGNATDEQKSGNHNTTHEKISDNSTPKCNETCVFQIEQLPVSEDHNETHSKNSDSKVDDTDRRKGNEEPQNIGLTPTVIDYVKTVSRDCQKIAGKTNNAVETTKKEHSLECHEVRGFQIDQFIEDTALSENNDSNKTQGEFHRVTIASENAETVTQNSLKTSESITNTEQSSGETYNAESVETAELQIDLVPGDHNIVYEKNEDHNTSAKRDIVVESVIASTGDTNFQKTPGKTSDVEVISEEYKNSSSVESVEFKIGRSPEDCNIVSEKNDFNTEYARSDSMEITESSLPCIPTVTGHTKTVVEDFVKHMGKATDTKVTSDKYHNPESVETDVLVCQIPKDYTTPCSSYNLAPGRFDHNTTPSKCIFQKFEDNTLSLNITADTGNTKTFSQGTQKVPEYATNIHAANKDNSQSSTKNDDIEFNSILSLDRTADMAKVSCETSCVAANMYPTFEIYNSTSNKKLPENIGSLDVPANDGSKSAVIQNSDKTPNSATTLEDCNPVVDVCQRHPSTVTLDVPAVHLNSDILIQDSQESLCNSNVTSEVNKSNRNIENSVMSDDSNNTEVIDSHNTEDKLILHPGSEVDSSTLAENCVHERVKNITVTCNQSDALMEDSQESMVTGIEDVSRSSSQNDNFTSEKDIGLKEHEEDAILNTSAYSSKPEAEHHNLVSVETVNSKELESFVPDAARHENTVIVDLQKNADDASNVTNSKTRIPTSGDNNEIFDKCMESEILKNTSLLNTAIDTLNSDIIMQEANNIPDINFNSTECIDHSPLSDVDNSFENSENIVSVDVMVATNLSDKITMDSKKGSDTVDGNFPVAKNRSAERDKNIWGESPCNEAIGDTNMSNEDCLTVQSSATEINLPIEIHTTVSRETCSDEVSNTVSSVSSITERSDSTLQTFHKIQEGVKEAVKQNCQNVPDRMSEAYHVSETESRISDKATPEAHSISDIKNSVSAASNEYEKCVNSVSPDVTTDCSYNDTIINSQKIINNNNDNASDIFKVAVPEDHVSLSSSAREVSDDTQVDSCRPESAVKEQAFETYGKKKENRTPYCEHSNFFKQDNHLRNLTHNVTGSEYRCQNDSQILKSVQKSFHANIDCEQKDSSSMNVLNSTFHSVCNANEDIQDIDRSSLNSDSDDEDGMPVEKEGEPHKSVKCNSEEEIQNKADSQFVNDIQAQNVESIVENKSERKCKTTMKNSLKEIVQDSINTVEETMKNATCVKVQNCAFSTVCGAKEDIQDIDRTVESCGSDDNEENDIFVGKEDQAHESVKCYSEEESQNKADSQSVNNNQAQKVESIIENINTVKTTMKNATCMKIQNCIFNSVCDATEDIQNIDRTIESCDSDHNEENDIFIGKEDQARESVKCCSEEESRNKADSQSVNNNQAQKVENVIENKSEQKHVTTIKNRVEETVQDCIDSSMKQENVNIPQPMNETQKDLDIFSAVTENICGSGTLAIEEEDTVELPFNDREVETQSADPECNHMQEKNITINNFEMKRNPEIINEERNAYEDKAIENQLLHDNIEVAAVEIVPNEELCDGELGNVLPENEATKDDACKESVDTSESKWSASEQNVQQSYTLEESNKRTISSRTMTIFPNTSDTLPLQFERQSSNESIHGCINLQYSQFSEECMSDRYKNVSDTKSVGQEYRCLEEEPIKDENFAEINTSLESTEQREWLSTEGGIKDENNCELTFTSNVLIPMTHDSQSQLELNKEEICDFDINTASDISLETSMQQEYESPQERNGRRMNISEIGVLSEANLKEEYPSSQKNENSVSNNESGSPLHSVRMEHELLHISDSETDVEKTDECENTINEKQDSIRWSQEKSCSLERDLSIDTDGVPPSEKPGSTRYSQEKSRSLETDSSIHTDGVPHLETINPNERRDSRRCSQEKNSNVETDSSIDTGGVPHLEIVNTSERSDSTRYSQEKNSSLETDSSIDTDGVPHLEIINTNKRPDSTRYSQEKTNSLETNSSVDTDGVPHLEIINTSEKRGSTRHSQEKNSNLETDTFIDIDGVPHLETINTSGKPETRYSQETNSSLETDLSIDTDGMPHLEIINTDVSPNGSDSLEMPCLELITDTMEYTASNKVSFSDSNDTPVSNRFSEQMSENNRADTQLCSKRSEELNMIQSSEECNSATMEAVPSSPCEHDFEDEETTELNSHSDKSRPSLSFIQEVPNYPDCSKQIPSLSCEKSGDVEGKAPEDTEVSQEISSPRDFNLCMNEKSKSLGSKNTDFKSAEMKMQTAESNEDLLETAESNEDLLETAESNEPHECTVNNSEEHGEKCEIQITPETLQVLSSYLDSDSSSVQIMEVSSECIQLLSGSWDSVQFVSSDTDNVPETGVETHDGETTDPHSDGRNIVSHCLENEISPPNPSTGAHLYISEAEPGVQSDDSHGCLSGKEQKMLHSENMTLTETPNLVNVTTNKSVPSVDPEVLPYLDSNLAGVIPVDSVSNWPYLEEEVHSEFPRVEEDCSNAPHTNVSSDSPSSLVESPHPTPPPENNDVPVSEVDSSPNDNVQYNLQTNSGSDDSLLTVKGLKCRLSWKKIFALSRADSERRKNIKNGEKSGTMKNKSKFVIKTRRMKQSSDSNEIKYGANENEDETAKSGALNGNVRTQQVRNIDFKTRGIDGLELGPAKIEVRIARSSSPGEGPKTWKVVDDPKSKNVLNNKHRGHNISLNVSVGRNNCRITRNDTDGDDSLSTGSTEVPIVLVRRLILKRRCDGALDVNHDAKKRHTGESLSPSEEESLSPNEEESLSPNEEESLSPNEEESLSPNEEESLSSNEEESLSQNEEESLSPNEEESLSPKEPLSPNESVSPDDSLSPNDDISTLKCNELDNDPTCQVSAVSEEKETFDSGILDNEKLEYSESVSEINTDNPEFDLNRPTESECLSSLHQVNEAPTTSNFDDSLENHVLESEEDERSQTPTESRTREPHPHKEECEISKCNNSASSTTSITSEVGESRRHSFTDMNSNISKADGSTTFNDAESDMSFNDIGLSACSTASEDSNKQQLPRVIIKRTIGMGNTNNYQSFLRSASSPSNSNSRWQPFVRLERSTSIDQLAKTVTIESGTSEAENVPSFGNDGVRHGLRINLKSPTGQPLVKLVTLPSLDGNSANKNPRSLELSYSNCHRGRPKKRRYRRFFSSRISSKNHKLHRDSNSQRCTKLKYSRSSSHSLDQNLCVTQAHSETEHSASTKPQQSSIKLTFYNNGHVQNTTLKNGEKETKISDFVMENEEAGDTITADDKNLYDNFDDEYIVVENKNNTDDNMTKITFQRHKKKDENSIKKHKKLHVKFEINSGVQHKNETEAMRETRETVMDDEFSSSQLQVDKNINASSYIQETAKRKCPAELKCDSLESELHPCKKRASIIKHSGYNYIDKSVKEMVEDSVTSAIDKIAPDYSENEKKQSELSTEVAGSLSENIQLSNMPDHCTEVPRIKKRRNFEEVCLEKETLPLFQPDRILSISSTKKRRPVIEEKIFQVDKKKLEEEIMNLSAEPDVDYTNCALNEIRGREIQRTEVEMIERSENSTEMVNDREDSSERIHRIGEKHSSEHSQIFSNQSSVDKHTSKSHFTSVISADKVAENVEPCEVTEKESRPNSVSNSLKFEAQINTEPVLHGDDSCQACGHIYRDKDERTAHIRRHPYHCQRCHMAFKSEVDFVSHLSEQHPRTRERHHCLLCERSFPTADRHKLHVMGRTHRHLELTQRRTIHTLFSVFTGRNCPVLPPLSESELAGLNWFPVEPGTIHFYHQATPLQRAVQDLLWRRKGDCTDAASRNTNRNSVTTEENREKSDDAS